VGRLELLPSLCGEGSSRSAAEAALTAASQMARLSCAFGTVALSGMRKDGLRRPCLVILSLSLFYQVGWYHYARFWDLFGQMESVGCGEFSGFGDLTRISGRTRFRALGRSAFVLAFRERYTTELILCGAGPLCFVIETTGCAVDGEGHSSALIKSSDDASPLSGSLN
jgi:hypothetical protein